MFNKIIIAMFIVVIIIIIYTLLTLHTNKYEDYMSGVWLAEKGSTFCNESDIDSMMLYINPADYNWLGKGNRQCYLIIMPGVASSMTLRYTKGWCGPNIGNYTLHGTVEFDSDQIWDENIMIDMNMTDGVITIYTMVVDDGEKTKLVYAKLCKQHDTTNLLKDLEKVEMVDSDEISN